MSIDRWMNKEDMCVCVCVYLYTYIYTHNGILLNHKKEWNNAICSDMDGPRDYHIKWSKSDSRERQTSYDIAYMWNLKKWYKWTYLQNRNRFTGIENKLMVTKGDSEGRGAGIN